MVDTEPCNKIEDLVCENCIFSYFNSASQVDEKGECRLTRGSLTKKVLVNIDDFCGDGLWIVRNPFNNNALDVANRPVAILALITESQEDDEL